MNPLTLLSKMSSNATKKIRLKKIYDDICKLANKIAIDHFNKNNSIGFSSFKDKIDKRPYEGLLYIADKTDIKFTTIDYRMLYRFFYRDYYNYDGFYDMDDIVDLDDFIITNLYDDITKFYKVYFN